MCSASLDRDFAVGFRRLTDADLPLLHRWLNEPGVVRWWEGEDVSWQTVAHEYGSASTDPTEHWIVSLGERPIGWIQCWAVADNLDDDEVKGWLTLGVDHSAAGIDYLIGEPSQRGSGLGAAMIAAFVDEVVFGRHPGWTQVCASPYEANTASWRVLEKAGFTAVGTLFDDDGPYRLMSRRRLGGAA